MGEGEEAPVSNGGKGSKIVNRAQMSGAAFIVVGRMEILGLRRSGSNVRVVETGLMRKPRTLV